MKVIDLSRKVPALPRLLKLAGKEDLILKTSDGHEFLLAQVEDRDEEIDAIARNKKLVEFLRRRSREKATLSLAEVRARLAAHRQTAASR
jgi:Holliday junction resolvase-like predicted endonuclease